jgi:glycerate 2-kinase
VTVPHGYPEVLPESERAPERIAVREAGHPTPDGTSLQAAREAEATAQALGAEGLLIVLVSGGGSALWGAPAEGVSLDDVQETTRLLLASGAEIGAVNAVRKHLTRLGGGQLARAAVPADVLALVLSDVPGDDPATVASGPASPDPSTYAEAVTALEEAGVWEAVPEAVRQRLRRGREGALPETPKPGDPALGRVRTLHVGSNATAQEAAVRAAKHLGYVALLREASVVGEARAAGRTLAAEALALPPGTCLIGGGETTVAVTGGGRGGRNQELALAAALALDGADRAVALLSGGTDGVDGPTDAAGAWATADTAARARALGYDPADHLARNDSHSLFDALGQLLRPGPTHTNVMDLQVVLTGPR